MTLKNRADIISAMEQHDVGCPEPALAVDSIDSNLILAALCLSSLISELS